MVINVDHELDEEVYDEIIESIEDSNEFDSLLNFAQKIHDKYNLSEKLTAQLITETLQSNMSEEDQ